MPEVTNNSADQFGKFGQIRPPNWGGGCHCIRRCAANDITLFQYPREHPRKCWCGQGSGSRGYKANQQHRTSADGAGNMMNTTSATRKMVCCFIIELRLQRDRGNVHTLNPLCRDSASLTAHTGTPPGSESGDHPFDVGPAFSLCLTLDTDTLARLFATEPAVHRNSAEKF